MGRIVLPPSDVKLMSCYFHCASYFRVIADINLTHKDALGTLSKDCVNEINGHRPNFEPDLHLPKYCFWGKAPMVGWGKAPINGCFAPTRSAISPLLKIYKINVTLSNRI